jgi:hypothetical protein
MQSEIDKSSFLTALFNSFTLYHGLVLFGFLTAALFKLSTPIRYYVKFVVYVFLTMTVSLLLIPVLLFRPTNARNIG